MTLALVSRIMVDLLFLWGMGMVAAPSTMAQNFGFEETAGLFTMMHGLATFIA